MPHAPFVPLRIFSSYTMLEGAIEPEAIAARARELGFPAAGLCDRNGLYAAMPFSEACAAAGVQPIVGALLAVARPDMPEGARPVHDWLALYAQDEAGYHNLCRLVSMAHCDRPGHEDAHVPFAALEGRTDGLIALTAGAEGALARLFAEEQDARAIGYAERLAALFPGRLYVEIARRFDEVEGKAEPRLIDLAYAHDLPLVATNPCCFAEESFHAAHDAMLCIAGSAYVDSEDRARSSPDAWLKPAKDMKALFEDLPEALANTLVVAQRCAVMAPKRRPILPTVAGGGAAEEDKLRADARAGLAARLAKLAGKQLKPRLPSFSVGQEKEEEGFDRLSQSEFRVGDKAYWERLEFELDVICSMGFPGYFLIVADFIKWAKANDIPVGPGRGSGAGSVVAWALTITDLDPIKLGLLFERFLNPERVSMPDFDIDFCETRRDEVIAYVQETYGRGQVAQIITFGRLKARAVLKDTGRVLQMSYGQVDRLAKLVPNHPTDPWTLSRTLGRARDKDGKPLPGVPEFISEARNAETRRLIDIALKLEGLPRHSSTHAAGVVIGDRPLHELVPLYRDPRSDIPVTQFDMKYVEKAGLVKFDFLGLKTLSVLKEATRLLSERGVSIDLDALAWDDPAVYKLLQKGDTVGVFQLESEGMRRTLASVRPTAFEDIIALVSLYRPGPMEFIGLFGERKNGRAITSYPHPLLKDLLAPTYGIMVYQEQVMQAAQILAGYSLGEADLLRRAMGKKIKAEMDAQRQRFVEGCLERNGIKAEKANELFDLIDKFAGYGFNKSHAAAYALLAYQTAWLKAHYPHEFFAASMSFDCTLTDKLAVFADDMKRLGVEYRGPDVNASDARFSVEDTDDGPVVRYALAGLKGVGGKAMEQLVEEREAGGRFASLDDFANRVDPRLLNKKQIESLAGAGAFDALEPDRAGVFAVAETVLAVAGRAEEARTSGQHGLFGGGEAKAAAILLPKSARWSIADRMRQEKEAFGFYFSAHPVERYRHLAEARGAKSFEAVSAMRIDAEGDRVHATMAALIEDVWERTSGRGRRYLGVACSDASGGFKATCFDEETGAALKAACRMGGCGLLQVELDRRAGEETPRITIRQVTPFEGMAASARMLVKVTLDEPAGLIALADCLEGARGGRGELLARCLFADGEAELRLGRGFLLDAELAARIEGLPGVRGVELSASEGAKLALVG